MFVDPRIRPLRFTETINYTRIAVPRWCFKAGTGNVMHKSPDQNKEKFFVFSLL